MNSVALILALSCAVGVLADLDCSTLDKKTINAKTFLEPYKNLWRIVTSTIETFKCINFEYLTGRNGELNLGTGIYHNYDNGTHMIGRSVVKNEDTQWDCHHDDNTVLEFHASFVGTESFCLYFCKSDFPKVVGAEHCMARSSRGVEEINAELKKEIYQQTTFFETYKDTCTGGPDFDDEDGE